MENLIRKQLKKNRRVVGIEKKIRDGNGTLQDAAVLAAAAGEAATEMLGGLLDSTFPDGQIPLDDARRIVAPVLTQLYQYTSELTASAVSSMNLKSGIGMKGIHAEPDVGRIESLARMISERSFKHAT